MKRAANDDGGQVDWAKLRGNLADGSKAIGRRIAELRQEVGFTQAELAGRLGVSQQYISNYEQGKVRLPTPLLPALVRALGVSADEFLGLAARRKSPGRVDHRFLKRLPRIARLTRRDRDALLRTVDAYLERVSEG